jgi:hypothetical protein
MNRPKFLSYREAWRRINAALAGEFYFEVVTLCESIIADRVLSYVRGIDRGSQADVFTSFSRLIGAWRELVKGTPSDVTTLDLIARVDRWRKNRNEVLHGLSKSMPGLATQDVNDFIQTAKEAAQEGAELARAVSSWHRRELGTHRKSASIKSRRAS